MDRLKIAVAARCFPGPLKRSLQVIAQSGARGVQFDARNELKSADFSETGRRQFLHFLDEVGLSVASLSFPSGRPLFDPEHLEARIAALKSVMQFSAQLKCRVVTLRVGRIPDDAALPSYKMLIDILNDLCRYGNHVGSTLAITPTSDSAEILKRLIVAVTEGPVGVNFDPAVFVMSGQDVIGSMRTLHDVLIHIQVRDAIRDIDGEGQEVPVGQGEVDWPHLLALIEESAYRGWLTADRTAGEDRAGDVIRAVEFLRQLAQG